ncbi:hypothetical protein H4217_003475 [Coemansia sp. RSA 1939]|nr:hypothetical protein H4217_003475 [Coemansia sp. RSA 1939]KAJ2694449.1 hypothetical protein GGH99_000671 [Coemansia sp. RSA 1285]
MSLAVQRPLAINELKNKDIKAVTAAKSLAKFLNNEPGVQLAPNNVAQQLRQLSKCLTSSTTSSEDTMFGTGGFGNTAANTGGGGFGGFGQASGGGGTGGNAGGGTFGRFGASSSTGGSAFGSTSTAPGTSSLFGSSSNTAVGSGSGFGSTGAGGFGVSSQQQATGSARVAYEPYTERGPAGRKDVFHNICFMSAYSDASPEELRVQDYQAGRKKPDSIATGAAGSGSIFGQPASSAGGSAFGSGGGAFGAASTPSKPAAGFGAGGGFASGSGIGGFGQTSTAGATGGFGAASKPAGFGSTGTGAFGGGGLGFGNTPAAGGGGTGLFGQPAAAASSSGFGTTSTAPSAFGAKPAFGSTGGAFGSSLTSQPAASTAGTTGFGASNAFGTSTGGGGGFGQTGTNTAFGAGNTATGSGGGSFGFGGGGTNAGVGSGGMFGTGNAGAGGSIFGNKPAATGFGNTSTAPTTGFGVSGTGTGAGGAFGTGGGLGVGASGGGSSLFGNKPAATGFGVTSTAAPAAFGVTSTGGAGNLFGGTSTAGTGGGSLFGTTTNTAGTGGGPFGTGNAGGTSLFGQTGTANTGSSSLFGTANTGVGAASGAGAGGGLFGTTTNAAPSAGGGFFAAKPAATTSLGGGGSLFGTSAPATNTALAPSAAGGSLFGTAGAGAATNPTGTAGGGLFGTGGSGFSTTGGGIGTSGGGGLFGIKPAASLAPGAAASSGGGLFGTSTGGGGLFSTQQPAQQFQQQQQPFPQQQQQQPAQSFGMFGAQQPQQQQAQGAQHGLFTTQIDRQPYGANALFDTTKLANKAAAGGSGLSRFSSHLTATPLRAAATEGASDKEAERKKRGLTLAVVASPAASSTVGSRLRARGFAASSTAAKKRVPGVPVPPTPAMAPRTRAGTTIGIFGRDGFLAPDTQLPHASVKRLVITRRPSFGASSAAAATPAPASSATPAPAPAPAQTPGPRVADPWAISQSTAPTHALIEEEDGASDTPTEEADAADDDGYGEYWMRPSLDELRAMTTQQLRAVRSFTVGCGGLGQVSFSKPVDLTTVGSLSAIAGGVILFGNHVCTVYPDESNKPPRGQGLNVPAVISLHECWPTLAATGAAINDMADARVRKHIRRLRRVPETEFVDFVSGTWIFKVAHFSRYGLDDLTEDGADEEDMVPIEEIQEQQQHIQPIRPVRAAPKQLLAGVRRAESLRRAPVMRASLFATATPAASAQPADNQAALLSFAAAPKRKRSAHSPLRASTVGSSISGADAFAPSLAALDLPPPGKYLRAGERTPAVARAQPYARSLAYGRSGMRADAGLMMARSFRAAFGPQGQLVYLQGGAARQVVVVDSVARHLHAPTRTLDEHRALHLATVSAFRAQPHDISAAAAGALAQLPESERSILDLAALLFDDAHGPAPAHVRAVRRRQGLTRWLMRAVGDAVQRDLLSASSTTGGGSVAAASVFALLTGHRIEAACLAATSHRDYRLATLVAQCGAGGVGGGGNDAQVQELVRAQLARMDASRDYRRVYELLAGAPANRVAAGLDWKRAFGLSLWYAGSPADDVADSVVRYERAFTSAEDGSVALPLPAWRPASDDGESSHSGIWDPAFQLLRVYSDVTLPLERVLPPESFSPARGDVRMPALVAWLLFVVRKVRGFDESLAYDRLLAGWAAQLEALGLWQWACYVLLQLSSSESHRAHAICMLIERSIPSDSDFDFDSGVCAFLRDDLRIPESWLNDARVTRSRYDMDRTHAADIENDSGEATMHHLSCLLRAGEQAAAHSLVLQRIAPDAVLCGDYKLLRRVLADIDVSRVRDWASGGQVYESFLAGVEDLPAALERIASAGDDEDDSSMQQDIGAIYQQMVSLVAALPSLATRFESRSAAPTGFYDGCEVFLLSESEARDLRVKCSVAISDMASVVTRLIHEMEAAVGDVGARTSPAPSSSTLLPLAQDMRILRTFKMARSCFDTLVGSSLVV